MPGGNFDEGCRINIPVVLAEAHAEPAGHTLMVVPFANTTKNARRFPARPFADDERKAKTLGIVLEEKRRWRFSDSH
jgi:hypothetical protein